MCGILSPVMSLIGIYDGDCGICSAFVRLAEARVRRSGAAVTFVPSAALDDRELARYGLTHERCLAAFQVVDAERGANLAEGAAAIRLVLARTGGLLGWIARAVSSVPPLRWAERHVYAAIARNRARISVAVGLDACSIESTSEARREVAQ